MKKLNLVLVLALSSSAAFAGMKGSYPVQITVGSTTTSAEGALGTARNSVDDQQYIGCTIYAFSTSANPTVLCTARNAAGTTFVCNQTGNTALAQVVNALNSSSRVFFQSANSDPTRCTHIQVNTYSYIEPPR